MKPSTSRLSFGLLGGAALFTFFTYPVVSLGGKIAVSGSRLFDMADRFGNENFWIYLFMICPIAAIICSLLPQTKKKNLVSSAVFMFVPVIWLFTKLTREIQMEKGVVIYILLSIAMLICAAAYKEEEEEEEEEKNPYRKALAREKREKQTDTKQQERAREFDEEKLTEIVSNAALYDQQLVEASQREIALRKEAETLRPIAEQKSDEELMEIIQSEPGTYNPAIVYCSNDVMAERVVRREEEEERLREEERKREEQEAEEARVRAEQERIARQNRQELMWKKYRWWALLGAAILIAVAAFCYWQSDTHRYRQGYDHQNNSRPDKAIEYYAMLSNPNSSHYCEAKYLLAKLYLGKKEYGKAAEAWRQAVSTGKWEYPQAYRDYAEYCITGTLAPEIPQDIIKAANLYKNSPDIGEQLKAGALYYEYRSYLDAYKIFNRHSGLKTAQGYIGLMHLYGQAGLSHSAETAWKYLKDAPETHPFLAAKGDLTLYFNRNGVFSVIDEARALYEKAAARDPEREDYRLRYNVLNSLCNAKKKHEHISYWERGPVFWDGYTFENGSYRGEMSRWNNVKGAHGWGAFQFKNKELNIGHFRRLENHGECLRIIPSDNSLYIEVGQYKYDQFVNGFSISADDFIVERGSGIANN